MRRRERSVTIPSRRDVYKRQILDRTLDKVGGKGLFVKELDAALLDGQVDFTVHSLSLIHI